MRPDFPRPYFPFVTILLLLLTCATTFAAEPTLLDRVRSVFGSIAEGFGSLGEKSEQLIEPRFGPLKEVGVMDFTNLVTTRRTVDRSIPVDANVQASVSSEFGEIRVEGWDQPIVQVRAEISAGAATEEEARIAAEQISVQVDSDSGRVTIKTVYPTPDKLGKLPVAVTYAISVPRTAQLLCQNAFGDIAIQNIEGAVTIDSRYGVVDLNNLGSPVSVHARGDLPVTAKVLRAGGSFNLQRAPSSFSNIAGRLNVTSFAGPVELHDLSATCDVDVTAESADIRLYYRESELPDLEADAFFSSINIDSGIPVVSLGNLSTLRYMNQSTQRKARLRSSFNPISIAKETSASQPTAVRAPDSDLVQSTLERVLPVSAGIELSVEAMIGDIEIVGVDDANLTIQATQLAHVQSTGRAREVIESLSLTADSTPGQIIVRTQVVGDIAALGSSSYRLDLRISCPRGVPIRLTATNGKTSITGCAGPITIVQQEGTIHVSHIKGEMNLTNQRGDITAENTGGPLTATTVMGGVSTSNVFGAQTVTASQGKVVIDAPHGQVIAKNNQGDIRMIALDGIFGNCELDTQQGNLSLVVSPAADAAFLVTCENGTVIPSENLPLSGSVKRTLQEYQGRLNNGLYNVVLRAKDGKIVID